jgi:ribosomal protein S18 acetylase RimI-like enzyme
MPVLSFCYNTFMQIDIITQANDELVEAFERLLPQLNPGYPPLGIPDLERILTQECVTLFVARDEQHGGRITGTLTLIVFSTPTGTHSWIEDVVVDDAARGQGIGEALTRAAIQHAARLGAKAVDLTSRPARAAANRLYQRIGFEHRESNLYRLKLK